MMLDERGDHILFAKMDEGNHPAVYTTVSEPVFTERLCTRMAAEENMALKCSIVAKEATREKGVDGETIYMIEAITTIDKCYLASRVDNGTTSTISSSH